MPVRLFPKLAKSGYKITSNETDAYNCIAWGFSDDSVWCDPWRYWPDSVKREWSINRLIEVFETRGFEVCEDGDPEDGFEKVAIYAVDEEPKHAARQLPNNKWTSKLGEWIDIEHELEGLEGNEYGRITTYLRRRR